MNFSGDVKIEHEKEWEQIGKRTANYWIRKVGLFLFLLVYMNFIRQYFGSNGMVELGMGLLLILANHVYSSAWRCPGCQKRFQFGYSPVGNYVAEKCKSCGLKKP